MGLAQVRDDAHKYGECPSADALESSFFLQYKVSCHKKDKEKEKKKKKCIWSSSMSFDSSSFGS